MKIAQVGSLRRVARAAVAAVLLVAAGIAPAAASIPVNPVTPVPPGQARVWFYRVFFPDDTRGMPAVRINGQVVGYARAGVTFYRDIPPGPYHVSVDSVGYDRDQAQNIIIGPGQQVYLAIVSQPYWVEDFRGGRQPTYYVWVPSLQLAGAEMAITALGSGY